MKQSGFALDQRKKQMKKKLIFITVMLSSLSYGMTTDHQAKQSRFNQKTVITLLGTGLLGYHTYLQYMQCSGSQTGNSDCLDNTPRVVASAFFTVLSGVALLRHIRKQQPLARSITNK